MGAVAISFNSVLRLSVLACRHLRKVKSLKPVSLTSIA